MYVHVHIHVNPACICTRSFLCAHVNSWSSCSTLCLSLRGYCIYVSANMYRSVLQCVAVRYSVLQCVVVCCSVLQCVTVCCSVL